MPRLVFDGSRSLWPTEWPGEPRWSPRSPFEPRPGLRKLRVVVDMDTAGRAGADAADPQTLLAGLLRHPYLQVTRFSDHGPPAAVERLRLPDDQVAAGWVTLASGVPGDRGGLCYSTGNHAAYTGYDPETASRIAQDATGAYTALDPAEAQQQRDRDGVAMAVAMSLQPDLFVTGREHLLLRRDRSRYVTVCDTTESLAVLGLYLRAQGDFRYWFDPDGRLSPACDKRTFFWVGARDLLPAAWRWVSGCSQHSVAVKDDSLVSLAVRAGADDAGPEVPRRGAPAPEPADPRRPRR